MSYVTGQRHRHVTPECKRRAVLIARQPPAVLLLSEPCILIYGSDCSYMSALSRSASHVFDIKNGTHRRQLNPQGLYTYPFQWKLQSYHWKKYLAKVVAAFEGMNMYGPTYKCFEFFVEKYFCYFSLFIACFFLTSNFAFSLRFVFSWTLYFVTLYCAR